MTRALPLPPLPPFAVRGWSWLRAQSCYAAVDALIVGLILYVVLVLTMRQIIK